MFLSFSSKFARIVHIGADSGAIAQIQPQIEPESSTERERSITSDTMPGAHAEATLMKEMAVDATGPPGEPGGPAVPSMEGRRDQA